MKKIELTNHDLSLDELIKIASREIVILRKSTGEEFIFATVENFKREVDILGHDEEFIAFLNSRADQKSTIALESIENELN